MNDAFVVCDLNGPRQRLNGQGGFAGFLRLAGNVLFQAAAINQFQ